MVIVDICELVLIRYEIGLFLICIVMIGYCFIVLFMIFWLIEFFVFVFLFVGWFFIIDVFCLKED